MISIYFGRIVIHSVETQLVFLSKWLTKNIMSRIQLSVTIKHNQPLGVPSISLRTTNSDGYQHGGVNLGSVLAGLSQQRGRGLGERERVEVGVTASMKATRFNFCVNTV